jgi:hypothetical protein
LPPCAKKLSFHAIVAPGDTRSLCGACVMYRLSAIGTVAGPARKRRGLTSNDPRASRYNSTEGYRYRECSGNPDPFPDRQCETLVGAMAALAFLGKFRPAARCGGMVPTIFYRQRLTSRTAGCRSRRPPRHSRRQGTTHMPIDPSHGRNRWLGPGCWIDMCQSKEAAN